MGFFSRENENVLFNKIAVFLHGLNYNNSLRRVFFIGSIIYNEASYFEIIRKRTFSELLFYIDAMRADMRFDCLEMYLLEDRDGDFLVLYLLDPYEYMNKAQVLKIASIERQGIETHLDKMEIIYSKV